MIKAIAVDDNKLSLKVIENLLLDIDFIKLNKTFDSPVEALDYMDKYPVDLVFLDIDMPEINGLEFSKKVPQNAMVIFTTTHTEYAVEGFNLNAVDYMVKPFTAERLKQSAEKARFHFSKRNQVEDENTERCIFIRADYALHKINITDIVYVEALDDYLKIHIEGKKTLVTRMTMREMLEKLPVGEFLRIHRSFIVSANRIVSLKSKTLLLSGVPIPIGAKYEKELMDYFLSKKT